MSKVLTFDNVSPIVLEKDGQVASFLATGDSYSQKVGSIELNLFRPDAIYGSISNIFLRVYEGNEVNVYPLMGRQSESSAKYNQDAISYTGEVEGISYELTFTLGQENTAFWTVTLGASEKTVDILFAKDLGLANDGAILANELYSAQYIDYKVFDSNNGHQIAARQNMAQGDKNPYAQFGMLVGTAVGFATDGLKLFSYDYKFNNKPAFVDKDLPSEIIQGEFSYIALQSEKLNLDGEQRVVFYRYFQDTLTTAIEDIRDLEEIKNIYADIETTGELQILEIPQLSENLGPVFSSSQITNEEIGAIYPERELEEIEDGDIWSFFTPNHAHVISQKKELAVERPHATISTTFLDTADVSYELLTTSQYIYGLFNSQTVVGNTSQNKFLSANRGYLNQVKSSGQRLYVKLDGKYRLLQLPAVFETGLGYATWFYRLDNGDTLVINSRTEHDSPAAVLEVNSQQGIEYDFILTNQVVLTEHELVGTNILIEEHDVDDQRVLRFKAQNPNPFYPELNYDLTVTGAEFEVSDDRVFFENNESQNGSLVTLSINSSSTWTCVISGALKENEVQAKEASSFLDNETTYLESYKSLIKNFQISVDLEDEEIAADALMFKHTLIWYAHNAMVHYAVPHGLEQPGGAAWGTRDISQGPIEFFYTFGQFELARNTLLKIFANQNHHNGEWGQWFMFDKYPYRAGDAHGDIIFWPLKVISEYLLFTDDYTILEELVPYVETADGGAEAASLLDHIKLAYETITERYIGDTHLISFAGGDWNDTLQPANEELRENLVSTWTQALAYQAINQLGNTLEQVDAEFANTLAIAAKAIKNDFNKYLVKDAVISGLADVKDLDNVQLLLHPSDELTGINYRLLPMLQSITAEIIDREQAERNIEIIKDKLLYPDGAHLMDNPPAYHGGVSELFQRAEQATYIGREISLMYTHAHIRYMEALSMLGAGDDAWKATWQINPVRLEAHVPNAEKRQRNLYFSSSEGDFKTRYEFSENYDLVKTGDIKVKGGWRLYSSGPGIYLHQIVSNIIGIQLLKDGVVIHPTKSKVLEGASCQVELESGVLNIHFHRGENDRTEVQDKGGFEIGKEIENNFGKTQVVLTTQDLEEAEHEVHVYL